MDHYEKLRQRLDAHPAGAPPSGFMDKILRILFSPEEAEVACYLKFSNQPLSKIAEKSGRNAEELEAILERMADKAIIMSKMGKDGERKYSLLPTIPGLFEFPFMAPERTPNKEELGKLWHDYHTEALGDAFSGNPTAAVRVVPVQRTIPATTEVLHYEQVSHLIATAKYIALTECACRHSVGACDKPKEVCLIFEDVGKFLVERGYARQVDQAEALKALDLAEESGLVHCTNNSKDGPLVICNCCGCCCTLLRGINVCKNPHAVAISSYVVDYREDECIGCMACMDDRCQVYAIHENEDIVGVEIDRCIGCGLCVSVCPTGALTMKLRDKMPDVPTSGRELFMTQIQEKGKIEAFVKLNQE
ncbi:MAG: 4Fe-4S dicluster domain-containing protein [Candidatus Saccharibacteria bacterium]